MDTSKIELRAVDEQLPPDTTPRLCAAGFATLTTLVGIAEAWPSELAPHDVTERPVPAPRSIRCTRADARDSRTLHSREHS